MRVLACGGRDFNDAGRVGHALSTLHAGHPITVLIHGDAQGADRHAGEWAKAHNVEVIACPADWKKHGRSAGPIRNREMLQHGPELVVAFPGGRGTKDMAEAARRAGVVVWWPYR